jgi:hypothetical protein
MHCRVEYQPENREVSVKSTTVSLKKLFPVSGKFFHIARAFR